MQYLLSAIGSGLGNSYLGTLYLISTLTQEGRYYCPCVEEKIFRDHAKVPIARSELSVGIWSPYI